MKKRVSLLVLMIFLLFITISGCDTGSTSAEYVDRDYHKGTNGLEMKFLKNAPPSKIYEGDKLDIIVELENKGAWPTSDIFKGKLYVSGFDLNSIRGRWIGGDTLPANLQDYYAIAVNDMNADSLDSVTDVFNNFIADGSGLVVIGGENSYEKGEYKNSVFEAMLPVFVSSPGKKEGEISIVLVLDISGSTGASFGDSSTVDVEKALAIGVFRDLALNNRLAVVAFKSK